MNRRAIVVGLLTVLCAFTGVSAVRAAENLSSGLNLGTLTHLYQMQLSLNGTTNTSIERRIELERSRIHASIEDQVNDMVNALRRTASGGSLGDSIIQQRMLISSLQTRSDNAKVDRDLLNKEEGAYYDTPNTGTGSDTEYRLTATHQELLARRAALEEEISAFDGYLKIENERLSHLTWQQRWEQFALFIELARYLFIVLVVILLERLIRLKFLVRIENSNARYVVMKFFTATVYVLGLFWLFSSLSAQYPGILTSLAIFGAVVAFSIQDVLKDVVGWLVIVQRRLFTLGDRVTIGPYTGDIVDLGILRLTMVEVNNTLNPEVARAGQIIALPNAMVLSNPVMNYHANSDYVEGEIVIVVTFDSNWQRAREILQEILEDETTTLADRARLQNVGRMKHLYIAREQSAGRVVMEPKPRGITFTLRFLVPIGQRSTYVSRISERIFSMFGNEPSIRLALEGGQSTAMHASGH